MHSVGITIFAFNRLPALRINRYVHTVVRPLEPRGRFVTQPSPYQISQIVRTSFSPIIPATSSFRMPVGGTYAVYVLLLLLFDIPLKLNEG